MRIIILSIFTLITFNSCIFLKPVVIQKIEKIEVSELSMKSAKLNLQLKIENPNMIKIKISDIDLDVLIDNENIGKIQERDEFIIQANSNDIIQVKLDVNFTNVFSKAFRIIQILSSSDAKIRLKGTISSKSFFIKKTMQVDEEDIVELFKDK